MRKLNLKDYMVKTKVPDEMKLGGFIDTEFPYPFKNSILNLLFIPALQLSGAELVKQNILATKIEACKEDEILLENEEYDRVKKAIDTFTGFGKNDVELVIRVNDAEEVKD